MRSWSNVMFLIAACSALCGPLACDRKGASSSATTEVADGAVLPEFPSADPARWVNGAPTSLASVRGSPVLVEVWHPA